LKVDIGVEADGLDNLSKSFVSEGLEEGFKELNELRDLA